MDDSNPACQQAPHLVGDPVDTLTGAVTDQKLEFRLVGPLELAWMRHYDSSQHQRSFALGWGHTHGYDRRLRFEGGLEAGQLVYEGVLGERVEFPLLRADGDEVAMHGHRLVRISPQRYLLHRHAEPSMAFEFSHPDLPARLGLLFKGRHQLRFFYGSDGLLEGIVDSLGRRIDVMESADGRLHSLTLLGSNGQPDELLMAYRYDAEGNLQSTRNQAGHGYSFSYDDEHRLTSSTGRKGFRFQYSYDGQGRCVLAMGENRLYGVALNYAVPGRQTLVTKPDHGVWRYAFDAAGRLTQIQDALGGVQTFVRDPSGRVVFELDQNKALTQIRYDAAGAPVARITPTGQRVPLPEDINRPDPLDQRVAGNPAEYEYGALPDAAPAAMLPTAADLARVDLPPPVAALAFVRPPEQPALPASAFTVEPLGALWWPLPEQGRIFNHLGKLVAQRDEYGRERSWQYDASGNMAEYIDFDGSRWLQDTGRWHFLCGRSNPLQAVQQWTYTTSGKVERFTDAGGTVSEYRYDTNDHLIEVMREDAVRDRYLRDAVGNLVGKQAADGRSLLQLQIGPRNLPLKRTLASGEIHSFSYDGDGRPIAADTLKDRIALAYNDNGHRVLETRNGLGVEHNYLGGSQLAESTLFGQFSVRYRWADVSTLVITDPAGGLHEIRQLGHGLMQRKLGNGTEEFSQYDLLGRCLFKAVRHRSGHLWNRRFHWSGEGELRRVEDSAAADVRYDYDAAHRLLQRRADQGVERFHFDAADNLLIQPGLDGVALNGNRLIAANGESFAYDDRQHIALRLTARGETRYHYDSRDLLVRIDNAGGDWQADYDALGRRCRKSWRGQVFEFYWSGDQLIAEVAPDGRLRLYVYADPLALTPLMFIDYASVDAEPASGRSYLVFADQVGAPCLVEDEHGLSAWVARAHPFGRADVSSPGGLEFNFRWPGHYLDPETGLHYNRFRYYDPVLGRYLQSDPWGIAGGANVYAYRTNPLLKVDVRGLGEDGGEGCPKPKSDEEGNQEPTGKSKKALADMSDEDLQNHCKARADELSGQMTNPRDREGVTIAVTVVQKEGDPSTRRVLVTSSTNDGSLPRGVGPLHPNEEVVNPGPVLRSRNAPPDENGQVPQRVKITEHESGGATAEMVPEKRLYDVDPNTGQGTPYDKRSPANPDGETRHHAEQRAQNALQPGEEVAAMSPGGRPCCPGCQNALGDNLNKVPPDRRGTP